MRFFIGSKPVHYDSSKGRYRGGSKKNARRFVGWLMNQRKKV